MMTSSRDEASQAGVTTTAAALVELCRHAPAPDEPARRGAANALVGPYLSAFRGGGIEFDEVRGYQPGDDARCIDWRVTARTGRPHSRVFREERERPVWLVVDVGPDMHFGTQRAFKSLVAAQSAALISWWAHQDGDRVGGLVRSADETAAHPPRHDEARYLRFLDSMAAGTRAHSGECELSFDDAVGRVAAHVHPGSSVYVIGDFETLGAAGRRHLSQLARRCDLTCVLIYDALESAAPPSGDYRVSDGEAVRSLSVGSERARLEYESVFASRVEELTRFCRIHRIQLVSIRTDERPETILPEVVGRRHLR